MLRSIATNPPLGSGAVGWGRGAGGGQAGKQAGEGGQVGIVFVFPLWCLSMPFL